MNCKQCHKKSVSVYCSAKCRIDKANERSSLNYKEKGKEHFKHKTTKVSMATIQAIWPKGELAYKPN
jgi:hypothetical protein